MSVEQCVFQQPEQHGPCRSAEPAGQHVAGPVRAQIYAADADQCGQRDGNSHQEYLHPHAFFILRQQTAECQIDKRGHH